MTDPEALLHHAGFLRALARRLLDDDARAEDVVQDTLAVGWQRRIASRGFLATVARNFARMVRREEGRRRRREYAAARPESVSPPTAERIELQRAVVAAVAELAEPYRSTIVLRYFDGLKPGAIARRHDVPVKTVQTRLRRAVERLRGTLDRRHGRAHWASALLPLVRTAAPLVGVLAVKKTLIVAAVSVLALGVFAVRSATRTGARRVESERPTSEQEAGSEHAGGNAAAGQGPQDGDVAGKSQGAPKDRAEPGAMLRGTLQYAVADTAPAEIVVRFIGEHGDPDQGDPITVRGTPADGFEADVTALLAQAHVVELQIRVDQRRHTVKTLRVAVDRNTRPATIDPIAIELEPAALVTGAVRLPDGRPAAGASVALTTAGGRRPGRRPEELARTGANGEYAMRSSQAGRHFVVADVPGFKPNHVAVSLVPGKKHRAQDIAVLGGATIEGRITVNGTVPPQRVTVRAWRSRSKSARRSFLALDWKRDHYERATAEAKTDTDGRFRIGGVMPGKWTVRPSGLRGMHMDVYQDGTRRKCEAPAADVDFDLSAARIRVRTRDGRKARVLVYGGGIVSWATDERGVLELLVRPQGEYVVDVSRDGFEKTRKKITGGKPGETVEAEFDLKREPSRASVRVRLTGTAPPRFAGFGFFRRSDPGSREVLHRNARSENGVFELTDIPPGRYRVVVHPDAAWPYPVAPFLAAETNVDLPEGGSAEATVAVRRGGLLRIVAKTPERGQALVRDSAGRTVKRRLFTRAPGRGWMYSDRWYGPKPATAGPALPAGEYVVELSAKGYVTRQQRVRIVAGEVTEIEARLLEK